MNPVNTARLRIVVQARLVYGTRLIYPINWTAREVIKSYNRVTFTDEILEMLESKLNCDVVWVPEGEKPMPEDLK